MMCAIICVVWASVILMVYILHHLRHCQIHRWINDEDPLTDIFKEETTQIQRLEEAKKVQPKDLLEYAEKGDRTYEVLEEMPDYVLFNQDTPKVGGTLYSPWMAIGPSADYSMLESLMLGNSQAQQLGQLQNIGLMGLQSAIEQQRRRP